MKKLGCFLFMACCLTGIATASDMIKAAGSVFVNSAGEKIETPPSAKLIGFYFSSRQFQKFTPQLVEFYSNLKKEGTDFEIISVNFDKSEAEMMQYMQEAKMPWLAVPHTSLAAQALKQIKKDELKITGIPNLIILRDRQVITTNGRVDVSKIGSGAYKKWLTMEPEITQDPVAGKNEKSFNEPQKAATYKLPPPEEEPCLAIEINEKRSALVGKIVKIKFNRINNLQKEGKKPQYTGNLRSSEKSSGNIYTSHPGIQVIFPQERLGYFTKFIPNFGHSQNDVSSLIKPDNGEVYVQIGRTAKEDSTVVGDRYEHTDDGGEYKWSTYTDADVPDLTAKDTVTVDDVLLFPDQLNGKTVAVEFYCLVKSKNKPTGESPVYIASGGGHAYVQIDFPPEGKEFFKDITDQQDFAKLATVYAVVNVSRDGSVSLKAKGRRASGSGDDLSYKW